MPRARAPHAARSGAFRSARRVPPRPCDGVGISSRDRVPPRRLSREITSASPRRWVARFRHGPGQDGDGAADSGEDVIRAHRRRIGRRSPCRAIVPRRPAATHSPVWLIFVSRRRRARGITLCCCSSYAVSPPFFFLSSLYLFCAARSEEAVAWRRAYSARCSHARVRFFAALFLPLPPSTPPRTR